MQPKIQHLKSALDGLRGLPGVAEVRQCGFIAGIELEESPEAGLTTLAAEVCIEARRHGLLTRPIRNVVVLMPPGMGSATQVPGAITAAM